MESIQDKLMQQFQNMDDIYEAYAKSKGLTYLSLMVLEEICELGDGCTQKQPNQRRHPLSETVNQSCSQGISGGRHSRTQRTAEEPKEQRHHSDR